MGPGDWPRVAAVYAAGIATRNATFETEVPTFEQWDACVELGGCRKPEEPGWGRGKRPVSNISWYDAQNYANWLSKVTGKSYRLLTEAEYEYAERAGTATPFYWGETIGTGNANPVPLNAGNGGAREWLANDGIGLMIEMPAAVLPVKSIVIGSSALMEWVEIV